MTTRKRLEGALADWHPHPKENNSLVPVVRDAGVSDEIADRFFESAPELPTPEPPVAAEPEPRRVAIDSAAVRARRRYLMRYVAGAVSVAGVIGLAAIVRMTIARDASAAGNPRATSAIAASLPAAAPAEPMRAAADSLVASDDPGAVATDPVVAANLPVAADPALATDPPAVADSPAAAQPPTPAAVVEPAAAAAESPPPSAQAVADSRLAAANAKKEAQRALDRGHLADSIEAGEESVAIDPTDADAWLILGAAYQQQGHFADARRCFASCAQQAKRGSRGECGALLR
jgi:tetratricopeptide (TPR) repeat protein